MLINYSQAIQNDWEKLQKQWMETSSLWHDNNKEKFNKEIWEGFEPIVRDAIKSIEIIDSIVENAMKNI